MAGRAFPRMTTSMNRWRFECHRKRLADVDVVEGRLGVVENHVARAEVTPVTN